MDKRVKTVWIAILIICISAAMIGCNRGKEKEISGKVTVWAFGKQVEGLKIAAERFQRMNSKVEIDIRNMDTSEIESALAGKEKAPDIILVEDSKTQYFLKKYPKAFLSTSDYIDENKFLKSKITNIKANNKAYGIPWNIEPIAMCYRADILESAGIDIKGIKTWDDFIGVGKTLYSATGKYMFAISDESLFLDILMKQQGESYVDKQGKLVIDNKKKERAVSVMKDMEQTGLLYKAKSTADIQDAFEKEKVICKLVTPISAWEMIEQQGNVKGKVEVEKIPSIEQGGGKCVEQDGANLMIMSGTRNQEVSLAFSKFAVTDEKSQLLIFDSLKIFPSYIPLYDIKSFDQYSGYFRYEKIWKLFQDIGNQLPNTLQK